MLFDSSPGNPFFFYPLPTFTPFPLALFLFPPILVLFPPSIVCLCGVAMNWFFYENPRLAQYQRYRRRLSLGGPQSLSFLF